MNTSDISKPKKAQENSPKESISCMSQLKALPGFSPAVWLANLEI